MANLGRGFATDGLLVLDEAPARSMAKPKCKAVVEGSTSAPPQADPVPRRRPWPAATSEEEVPRPTPGSRTGQPSAAKRRRVAPRVAG